MIRFINVQDGEENPEPESQIMPESRWHIARKHAYLEPDLLCGLASYVRSYRQLAIAASQDTTPQFSVYDS